MIQVIKTENEQIIRSVLLDPVVYAMKGGIEVEKKDWVLPVGYNFYLILVDNEVGGLFETREISKICVEGHVSLLPKFMGTDTADEMVQAGFKYAGDVLKVHKIIGIVRSSHERCLKFCFKAGYRVFGVAKQAFIHQGKYNDLVYLEYTIK